MFVVPLLILALAAPDADKLIKKGVELRKKRKDAEALEVFREAHTVRPTPRSLAQIALAEQALAQWLEADVHLREALASTTDPWIRSNKTPLAKALAQIGEHLATVTLKNVPDGAIVRIGQRTGKSARVLCNQELLVTAALPGYSTYSRTLTPLCGKEEVLSAIMEKEHPPPPPPPAVAQKVDPAPAIVTAPVEPASSASFATYAYVAGGASLIGIGTGVAALVVREGHAKKYNDDRVCLPPNGLTRDQNCLGERRAAESAQLFSIIGFGAGGALAATAVALLLLDAPEKEPGLTCAPMFTAPGIACGAIFE